MVVAAAAACVASSNSSDHAPKAEQLLFFALAAERRYQFAVGGFLCACRVFARLYMLSACLAACKCVLRGCGRAPASCSSLLRWLMLLFSLSVRYPVPEHVEHSTHHANSKRC